MPPAELNRVPSNHMSKRFSGADIHIGWMFKACSISKRASSGLSNALPLPHQSFSVSWRMSETDACTLSWGAAVCIKWHPTPSRATTHAQKLYIQLSSSLSRRHLTWEHAYFFLCISHISQMKPLQCAVRCADPLPAAQMRLCVTSHFWVVLYLGPPSEYGMDDFLLRSL